MRWLAVFILLALAGPLAAQEVLSSDVVVRQSIEPASDAVIGQHVALYVDVLFRGDMPRPPRVSLPDMPGLQAFRFETQGTTMSETIGGESYVGQRSEFALYPRRGGAFDIPPAEVTLLDRQGDPAGNARGAQVRLEVRVPAGIDASQPVVATSRLTLDEQWTPAPGGVLKAGDAIVRRITRVADDVPGLAMSDLDFSAPAGARSYVDPPDIEDQVDRGAVTGRRVDRVTYVFERGGRFVLPAVAQPWWDLASGMLKTAGTPAVAVEVAAAPANAPTKGGRGMTASWHALLLGTALLLVVLVLGTRHVLGRRRGDDAMAERQAFTALRRVCATADAGAAYRALSRWRQFLAPAQNKLALQAAARLDAALFANDSSAWTQTDAAALLAQLKAIRRSTLSTSADEALPPLNPIYRQSQL